MRATFTSAVAVASILAVAPGLTTSLGDFSSPVAQAAITGFRDAPAASSIDMNQSVDLTLMIPDLRNGEPRDESEKPLGGVSGYTVTVTKLGVAPINTEEGYKKAAALTSADLKNIAKGESFTQVTDENGVVRFMGLEPGVYLIKSVTPKDSTKYYPQPQDLVVVVPTVNESGTWNYSPTIVAKFVPEDCECPPTEPCPLPTTPGPTPPPVTTTPGVPPIKTTTPGKPNVPGIPPVTKTIPGPTPTPTPGHPGHPGKPGTPGSTGGSSSGSSNGGSSSSGNSSNNSSSRGPLAVTGVQAAALAGIAAVLIGGGVVLISAKRKPRKEEEEV